jgi:hypothetical protein
MVARLYGIYVCESVCVRACLQVPSTGKGVPCVLTQVCFPICFVQTTDAGCLTHIFIVIVLFFQAVTDGVDVLQVCADYGDSINQVSISILLLHLHAFVAA